MSILSDNATAEAHARAFELLAEADREFARAARLDAQVAALSGARDQAYRYYRLRRQEAIEILAGPWRPFPES